MMKDDSEDLKTSLISKDELHYLSSPESLKEPSHFTYINARIQRMKSFYYRVTTGSTSGSVFCLLCLTFGTGILALPYSFKKTGIILGTFLFLLCTVCVYWTLRLLTKIAFKEGIINYSFLIHRYFGKNHVIIYEIMNVVNNFGTIIVYQQIISIFFISFLQFCGFAFVFEYPKLTRFVQMFAFCVFFQLPIALVKNISFLHRLSMWGTLALLYTVLVALIEFPLYFRQNFDFNKIKYFDFDSHVVKVMCMYFFAYASHNALLSVIQESKDPTKEKGVRIVHYAFIIELVTYLIVIFSGYLSTFDETNEIFIDREGQSIFLVLGKLLYTVSLTLHIALYYYISKPSLELFLNQGRRLTEKESFYLGACSLLILNCIAYYFTSISNVISLIGATACIYMMFIMPISLYLASNPTNLFKKYCSICILVFSLVVGFSYLLISFADTFLNHPLIIT